MSGQLHAHKRELSTLLLLISLTFTTWAQQLKGKITDPKGQAIPNATIYIREAQQGIAADDNGDFQLMLSAGVYHVELRSVGYETTSVTFEQPSEGSYQKWTLKEKILQLNELLVTPGKEDPAYNIMRNAIARAPYYRNNLLSYKAENYLKGTLKIDHLPFLMRRLIKDEKILGLVGKLLVIESKNEVNFKAPLQYLQKVLAFRSSIPKEFEPKNGLKTMTSSIYDNIFMDGISPLSAEAFSYYRFQFIEVQTHGKLQVDKIKLIPRYNSNNLFGRYIYIVEDAWNVFAVELTSKDMGSVQRVRLDYHEILPGCFLPSTVDAQVDINTMGIKGNGRYFSSIQYKNVQVRNGSFKEQHVNKAVSPILAAREKEKEKLLQKIENIKSKEKLSNRQARKLAVLTEKVYQIEKDTTTVKRRSLEIKENDLVKMSFDSLADKRSSLYWDSIRSVPLQKEEIRSFEVRDSLPVSDRIKTSSNSIEVEFGSDKNSFNPLTGGNLKFSKTSGLRFKGLLNGIVPEYNFVDGFWIGEKFTYWNDFSKKNWFKLSPSVHYLTARKKLNWEIKMGLGYAPRRLGTLRLEVGQTDADIQPYGAMRLINSFASLITADNVIRFYDKKYVRLENRIDIANGLSSLLYANYEERSLPENHTQYNFMGHTPTPNYPNGYYKYAFPDHKLAALSLSLSYTPEYYYRINAKGYKEYVRSAFPTFTVAYKKAFSLNKHNLYADYDKMLFNIRQEIELNRFNRFTYSSTVVKFLTSKQIFAPDYQYLALMPLGVTEKSFDEAFATLPNYSFTDEQWWQTHVNYMSENFLLKRLPFINKQKFNESLHLKSIWEMSHQSPYIEGGYSIGTGLSGRIGIFAGWKQGYKVQWAFRWSLPLLNIFQ